MNERGYHLYSAQELLQGLRAQQWSSEELTHHFLKRIAEFNPKFYAIHTLNPQVLNQTCQKTTDLFFKEFDGWILPVAPTAALSLQQCGQVLQTHLGQIPYSDFLGNYLCSTTLMGTPAFSIPIGLTRAGLPIGLQVHGPRFGELVLLKQLKQLLKVEK